MWMQTGLLLTSAVGQNGSNNTDCPDGNPIIWKYFQQCIYNTLQWASFGVGMASIVCWMCVLMPQIVENAQKIKSVGSISPGLLISWIFGDTTNLVGTVLTQQGLFQELLGVWFVLTDLIISSQLLYYHCVYKRRKRNKEVTQNGDRTLVLCIMGAICLTATFSGMKNNVDPAFETRSGHGRQLLSTDSSDSEFSSVSYIIGYALGVTSTFAYIASRLFQIYKNWREREVQGLQILTFIMAVLGNLLYGLAIILYSVDRTYILDHAPWIAGSWGIMCLDLTIVYQVKTYQRDSEVLNLSINVDEVSDEEAPLISSLDDRYGAIVANPAIVS